MSGWRRRPGGDDGARDGHLPFLTVAEAGRIRFLVRQAFAEHGREVAVYADHLRDDQGAEFGLWNVAAACHEAPQGEASWGRVVSEYVGTLLARVSSRERDLAGLSAREVRSRTYAKLFPAGAFPSPTGLSHLREPLPGLVESLVVDFPDAVSALYDSEVQRFGGLAALREAGLANLRALPAGERRHVASPDGLVTFDVLLGSSVYTASRVLVMPDLLARVFGTAAAPHGVLAAMATRHQVALHVVRDMSAVASLHQMARFALAGFTDGTGPLSPDVFWWHDGLWARVSGVDDGGGIHVIPDPDLVRVLGQLGDR